MAIGDQIRTARKQAGISQEDLAHRMGISRKTPQRWEANRNQPSARAVAKIAVITGQPVTFFYEDDDDEEAAQMAGQLQHALMQIVRAEMRNQLRSLLDSTEAVA